MATSTKPQQIRNENSIKAAAREEFHAPRRTRASVRRIAKALTVALGLTAATAAVNLSSQVTQVRAQTHAKAEEMGQAIASLTETAEQLKISTPLSWAVKTFLKSTKQAASSGNQPLAAGALQVDEAGLPPGGLTAPLSEFTSAAPWSDASFDYLYPIQTNRGVRIRMTIPAPDLMPGVLWVVLAGTFMLSLWATGLAPGQQRTRTTARPEVVYAVPPEVVEKFRSVITSATSLVKAAESHGREGASGIASEAEQLRRALREAATEMANAKRKTDSAPASKAS